MSISRRQFNITASTAAATVGLGHLSIDAAPDDQFKIGIPLGFDNFSIRAKKWKAPQLLQFAAEQKLDYVLFSDLGVFENQTDQYLRDLKAQADQKGIKIQSGTGSICPSAKNFTAQKVGDATAHLKKCIRIANLLGSNVVRCYLGSQADRSTEGGIQTHIKNTIEVLKSVRQQAMDNGIKIAVENHAGDLQAQELVELVKSAGEEYVGVTLDSGNATWTMENPQHSLETLGPYTVCSGMRDSVVWSTERGLRVAWTAVGDGSVDWKKYVQTFAKLCPDVPFQLETISGFNKELQWFEETFWKQYPSMKAADFAQFYRMTFGAEPVPTAQANDPEYQINDLKKSILYCKTELGLGLK